MSLPACVPGQATVGNLLGWPVSVDRAFQDIDGFVAAGSDLFSGFVGAEPGYVFVSSSVFPDATPMVQVAYTYDSGGGPEANTIEFQGVYLCSGDYVPSSGGGGSSGTTIDCSVSPCAITVQVEPAPVSAEHVADMASLWSLGLGLLVVVWCGKQLVKLFESTPHES